MLQRHLKTIGFVLLALLMIAGFWGCGVGSGGTSNTAPDEGSTQFTTSLPNSSFPNLQATYWIGEAHRGFSVYLKLPTPPDPACLWQKDGVDLITISDDRGLFASANEPSDRFDISRYVVACPARNPSLTFTENRTGGSDLVQYFFASQTLAGEIRLTGQNPVPAGFFLVRTSISQPDPTEIYLSDDSNGFTVPVPYTDLSQWLAETLSLELVSITDGLLVAEEVIIAP